MRVICLDPSGNYLEGNGTTGIAVFDDGELKDFFDVKAKDYKAQEEYWANTWWTIEDLCEQRLHVPRVIVCESYRLFETKAKSQSNSWLETPALIGYLRMQSWHNSYEWYYQHPHDKQRVADDQLVHMGVLEKRGRNYYCMGKPTIIHQRDAIRHGIFFHKYGKGRELLK